MSLTLALALTLTLTSTQVNITNDEALIESFGIHTTYFVKETEMNLGPYAMDTFEVSTEYDLSEVLQTTAYSNDQQDGYAIDTVLESDKVSKQVTSKTIMTTDCTSTVCRVRQDECECEGEDEG